LQALACVTGEKDDDGQGASEKAPKKEVSPVDKAFKKALTDASKVLETQTCKDIIEQCGFQSSKEIKEDKDKKNVTEQLKAAIALAGLGK